MSRTRGALVAHDGKRPDMVASATFNRDKLSPFDLIATGTTGGLLIEKVGLDIEHMLSGPHGGDAQIAAQVAEGEVKAVIFIYYIGGRHPLCRILCHWVV